MNISMKDVAKEIGISYSYFMTIAKDPSKAAYLNRAFMRNIAKFLGITTVMAYQYAGFLEDEDFNVAVTMDQLLEKSRSDLAKDPTYGIYCPDRDDWNELPVITRLLISSLYNEVQGMRLRNPEQYLHDGKVQD
jgi:transcriptional regulator with XRE-family HTH domain